ncbi:hypothetical protein HY969_01505 [Candidatus Kaiserbacteria bacterium]|nr:hypothetical protein [Candidatus Kaiserbacteria bacterium]
MSHLRLVPAFFVICSFVGIWHALPLLSVVFDEQYFVGGVLRAIEMKSIVPLPGDLPYGTITFYLNYVLQLPYLFILLVWHGFSAIDLKTYLIIHPEVAYFVPRLLSACVATGIAILYDRFLRSEGLSVAHRFASLSVIFATVVSTVTLHTGKMWVLSTALAAASALCTYVALKHSAESVPVPRFGPIFFAIVLAFAAFANFPLYGIFLINIPILFIASRHDALQKRALLTGLLGGGLLFLAVLAANIENIYALVVSTLTNEIFRSWGSEVSGADTFSFFTSLGFHAQQVFVAFPLVILVLAMAAAARAIENKRLFFFSIGYASLYFLTIAMVVPHVSDTGRVLHYLFPLAFFFSGAIVSITFTKMRLVLWGFCCVQTIALVYILYLLSVPTTYNVAARYVVQDFNQDDALIINDVVELDLPLNKRTANLLHDEVCESKCQYWRASVEDADFTSAVLTKLGERGSVDLSQYSRVLLVTDKVPDEACAPKPTISFRGGSSDGTYADVEYNLGHYLHVDFWRLSRLGKNLKLYELTRTCAADVLGATE